MYEYLIIPGHAYFGSCIKIYGYAYAIYFVLVYSVVAYLYSISPFFFVHDLAIYIDTITVIDGIYGVRRSLNGIVYDVGHFNRLIYILSYSASDKAYQGGQYGHKCY